MLSSFLFSCSDNGFNNKNPYIPNYSFTIDLNLNLPAYSSLQYPSNAIYYSGLGAKGIFVFNTGSGYNAFDAACLKQYRVEVNGNVLRVYN